MYFRLISVASLQKKAHPNSWTYIFVFNPNILLSSRLLSNKIMCIVFCRATINEWVVRWLRCHVWLQWHVSHTFLADWLQRIKRRSPDCRAGEMGGPVPQAPEISSLWRDQGGPVIFKNGPFWLALCCFLGSLRFLHTPCGPFWRFGALFRKSHQGLVPPPRNSFLQACQIVASLKVK